MLSEKALAELERCAGAPNKRQAWLEKILLDSARINRVFEETEPSLIAKASRDYGELVDATNGTFIPAEIKSGLDITLIGQACGHPTSARRKGKCLMCNLPQRLIVPAVGMEMPDLRGIPSGCAPDPEVEEQATRPDEIFDGPAVEKRAREILAEIDPDAEQQAVSKVAILCPICNLEECSCTLADRRAAMVLPKKVARARRKAALAESVMIATCPHPAKNRIGSRCSACGGTWKSI
jgi:hypothetical protein